MANSEAFLSHGTQLLLILTISFFVVSAEAFAFLPHVNSSHVASRGALPWGKETGSQVFQPQMFNPSEVFSVVLIIGGDIIQKAVANVSGHRVTFVAFSFGWVAYAFNSLMSAFGDGSLMPDRLLVTICTAQGPVAKPHRGQQTFFYFLIVIIQHAVAMIPLILYGDWSILVITAIGNIFAICTASLKEWRLEKFQARRHSNNSYAITRGNGHRHVFVIQAGSAVDGKFPGLFFDDLAGAVHKATLATTIKVVFLAILWVFFLVLAGGIKVHTWYLLFVGIIGMIQNVWVAGRHQSSKMHGIPVHINETIGAIPVPDPRSAITKTKPCGKPVHNSTSPMKVMEVLMEVERRYQNVGAALLPIFFQGSLRQDELDWWENAKTRAANSVNNPSLPPLP